MACEHLRELYRLCEDKKIRLSSSDLIHIVCTECDRKETCPSTMMDHVSDNAPQPTAATPSQE